MLRIRNYSLPTVEGAGNGHATGWNICKFSLRAPYMVKFVQQRAVQQETASLHDTISLRKLQSLGKCHNKNMSKAACLAIILAYATEEETVYSRKRSIWTKDWLKRSVFRHDNLIK